MSKKRTTKKEITEIAVAGERVLKSILTPIGNDSALYARCFKIPSKKELALLMTQQGLYVWSEPVVEIASAGHKCQLRKTYSASKSRISTLQANAPNLYAGETADYWKFTSLGELESFAKWYATL